MVALTLLWALASPVTAQADIEAEADRASLLYETHCVGCHTSVAHRRPESRVRSSAEVAAEVRRWSDYQKLNWSEDDIADVAALLVRRYYQFADDIRHRKPSR